MNKANLLIDFHTHSYREIGKAIEVVSIHPGKKEVSGLHTVGYHPWWTLNPLTKEELEFISHSYLNEPTCLGIGECGLDKLKGPCPEIQDAIFRQHLDLADQLDAPVIVHCVRQYDQLIQIRKDMGKTDWVIHGFIRNKYLAKSLLDQGFYLSCAPYSKMTSVFAETLKYIPLDRIFLETDSETTHNILERYHIFAELRSIPLNDLKNIVSENFNKFFKGKWEHQNG